VDRQDVSRLPYTIQTYSKLDDEAVEFEVIVGRKTGPGGEWVI